MLMAGGNRDNVMAIWLTNAVAEGFKGRFT